MNAFNKPEPDKDTILEALKLLHGPSSIIELRALHGNKRTDAGYFDPEHREQLADEAIHLNSQGVQVYVNLNPINPQLMGRYFNRVQQFASATATDKDVIKRKWQFVDIDPVRPSGVSATNEQIGAAWEVTEACCIFLHNEGYDEPIVAASGNGYHLLYQVDLPNDDTSRTFVKGWLDDLVARFDNDLVKVDRSVFNAGRIIKLWGTVACKGDHTPLTPWRQSHIIQVPDWVKR